MAHAPLASNSIFQLEKLGHETDREKRDQLVPGHLVRSLRWLRSSVPRPRDVPGLAKAPPRLPMDQLEELHPETDRKLRIRVVLHAYLGAPIQRVCSAGRSLESRKGNIHSWELWRQGSIEMGEQMNLLQAIYQPVVARAARRAFVGKNRFRNCPERGRFTAGEVNECVREAWRNVDHLVPNLPKEQTFGSRMNLMLACLSFAMLTVLLARGVERQYAIELISDAAWKVYKNWAILPKFLARILTRDPARAWGPIQTRMRSLPRSWAGAHRGGR